MITAPCGVGKTWLACALAQAACREGFTGLYKCTTRLFDELELAHGDGRFPRVFKALTMTQLLILDDWGPDRTDTQPQMPHGNASQVGGCCRNWWVDIPECAILDACENSPPVNVSAAHHTRGGQGMSLDGYAITLDNAMNEPVTYCAHFGTGARWSHIIKALDAIGYAPKAYNPTTTLT